MSLSFTGGSISQAVEINTLKLNVSTLSTGLNTVKTQYVDLSTLVNVTNSGKLDVNVFDVFSTFQTETVSSIQGQIAEINNGAISESLQTQINTLTGTTINSLLLDPSSELSQTFSRYLISSVQNSIDLNQNSTILTKLDSVIFDNYVTTNNTRVDTLSTVVNSISTAINTKYDTALSTNTSRISTLSSFINTQDALLTTNIQTLSSFVNTNVTTLNTAIGTKVATTDFNTYRSSISTVTQSLADTDYSWERRFLSVEEYIRAMENTYKIEYTDPATNTLKEYKYTANFQGLNVPPPPFTITGVANGRTVNGIFLAELWDVTIKLSDYGFSIIRSIVTPTGSLPKTLFTAANNYTWTFGVNKSLLNPAVRFIDSRGNSVYEAVINQALVDSFVGAINPNTPQNELEQRIIPNVSRIQTVSDGWALNDANLLNTTNLLLVSPPDSGDNDGDQYTQEYIGSVRNSTDLSGNAVLLNRLTNGSPAGITATAQLVLAIQNAGAKMVLIYRNGDESAVSFIPSTFGNQVTIPVITISESLGIKLYTRLRRTVLLNSVLTNSPATTFASLLVKKNAQDQYIYDEHMLVFQDRRGNLPQIVSFTNLLPEVSSSGQTLINVQRLHTWQFTPTSSTVKAFLKLSDQSFDYAPRIVSLKQIDSSQNLINTNVTIINTQRLGISNSNIVPIFNGWGSYTNYSSTEDLTFNNLTPGVQYVLEITADINELTKIDIAIILFDNNFPVQLTYISTELNILPIEFDEDGLNIIDTFNTDPYYTQGNPEFGVPAYPYEINPNYYTTQPYANSSGAPGKYIDGATEYIIAERYTGAVSYNSNITSPVIKLKACSYTKCNSPYTFNNILRFIFISSKEQMINGLNLSQYTNNYLAGSILQYDALNYIDVSSNFSFRWKVENAIQAPESNDLVLAIIHKFNSNAIASDVLNTVYKLDYNRNTTATTGIFNVALDPGYYKFTIVTLKDNNDLNNVNDFLNNNISVVLDDLVVFRQDSELKLNNPALFNPNMSTNKVFNNGQFIINVNSSFRLDNTQIIEAGYVYSTSPNVDINSPYKKVLYDLTTPIDPSNNYQLNTSLTTGLVENTLYYIKGYVKTASTTVDDQISLHEVIYTNEIQEYTLSRPLTTLLNVGQVTSNSIKVNYSVDNYGRFDNAFDSDPAAQFPLFRVQYKLASENDSAYQVYDPYRFTTTLNIKTSATIAGLLPGTEYDIRIAAFNPITGITPRVSESLRVSTVEGAPVVTFDIDAVDSNNDGRANITIDQVNNNVTLTNVILLSTGGSNRVMKKVGLLYTDNLSIASADINVANTNVQKIEVTSNMIENNNYSFSLTGLNNNKLYRFRAYGINDSLTNDLEKIGYTKIDEFNTVIINPVVETQIIDASLIQSNNVVLKGALLNDGGDNIVSIGFEISPGGEVLSNVNKTILTVPGTFNTQSGQYNMNVLYSTLTGLQLLSNTVYQFRAWAKNSKNIYIYGLTSSFTTSVSTPTVSTSTVVNITNNSVSAGGTLVSTGGDAIIRRGIVYSTVNENDGPEVGNVNSIFVTAPTNTVGSYVLVINGLTTLTTYYVRAFAENSIGISYGLLSSFTTQDSSYVPPPAFTGTNVLINATNANFGYQVGSVNFINGCPKIDPETGNSLVSSNLQTSTNTGYLSSSAGAVKLYRFVFVPTTSTTQIYINAPSPYYPGEEGIASIHKEGTSINLISSNILTQVGQGQLTYTSSYNTNSGRIVLNNVFVSDRGAGFGLTSMSVLTLNNLVVGARYVITPFTRFNDNANDISFAVLDSSNNNLPVYFSNFRAFNLDVTGLNISPDLIAENDVGPRGGSIGSGLNEVPSQGIASNLPAVYTSNITNISRINATVGVTVTSVGSDSDPSTVTCGIVFSAINANLTKNNVNSTTVQFGTGLGAKTFNLTGLIANTTYYVRSWTTSGFGTAYGAIIPFTTLMPYQVETVTIRNIETNQVDLAINRISSNGQLGYVYSTTQQNPTVTSSNTTRVNVSGAVGSNSYTIGGLLADTEYYLRSFIAATTTETSDVGYGQTITVRTRIGNTTNIAPDVDLSGNDLPLATYSSVYYKYSFTTGAADTGISMQLNLRKIKPTTDNFIMHIVDASGQSIMTPQNTTVTGNIGKTEINTGNNVLLSSNNAADGIVTITGLGSSTTYCIITKVIDPTIGGEIQVNIVGNNTPGVYIPLTYLAVSQLLSDLYTQLPYPITYGLLDGLQIRSDRATNSSINVDGSIKVFRTSASPSFSSSPNFTVISDSTTSQITTRQYSYAYLTSTTPLYVTYDGVEYDISGTAYGFGVFVPQNDTYIYKLEARDSVVDPSGRLVHITQQTSEHMGDGMYLITLGTLPNSDKVVSFTKISAFRLIGQVFGAEYNGWNADQFELVQDNTNKYVFTLNNVPFNQEGQFKIRSDSQWPPSGSGIFAALDLELDASGGITGMQDNQNHPDNMVFNGVNGLYNVILNMEDVQRIKLYLVPSSGVIATRFTETSATIANTFSVTHNKIGVNIIYTGNYSTSGIVYNTTSNVQLGGSSVNITFNTLLNNNYNFLIQGLTPQTTYYIRYYVKDVYNNIVYSNEVSVTTLATPLFTFVSAINNGSNSTAITYNYVGTTSGQYRLTSRPTNSGWTTNPGTSGSPLISIQQGNNLTLTANNVYEEGAYLRVVDVANFEYVSQPYQIQSLYNSTVNITGVTASGNDLTIAYNVNNAFTGYNNGLTDPAMWLDFKDGANWSAYTQIGGKLSTDSSNNTVIGYSSALSGGQTVEFRFRSVIGDYILSNVGSYTAPSNTKTILEIADYTQQTQHIFIPSNIMMLYSPTILYGSSDSIVVPFKNLANNQYYYSMLYSNSGGFPKFPSLTYSEWESNRYYLHSGNFSITSEYPVTYDGTQFIAYNYLVLPQLPLELNSNTRRNFLTITDRSIINDDVILWVTHNIKVFTIFNGNVVIYKNLVDNKYYFTTVYVGTTGGTTASNLTYATIGVAQYRLIGGAMKNSSPEVQYDGTTFTFNGNTLTEIPDA